MNPAMPKNTIKEEILQEITENLMEKILDGVNQKNKIHSRNLRL
jgi:hypothetical protein